MSQQLTIVMAQMNPVVGDLRGNTETVLRLARQAIADHQADVVVFPEMCLTGYPPEDILLRPGLYPQVQVALDALCAARLPAALVVGYPMMDELDERFNMAAWIENGQVKAAYMKQFLPNYGPFDEKRYFSPGEQACVVDYKGVRFGLLICEDIWKPTAVARTVEAGAEVLLNMNASPFHAEKHEDRLRVVRRRVAEFGRPVVYVNQVGGQDELVFDGASFAMDAEGEVLVQASAFESGLTPVRLLRQGENVVLLPGERAAVPQDEARLYQALVTGVRDFVDKNGIAPGIVLGLSGGIDSALTLAVAVDALGPERCEAVMMPYHYTSQASVEDARAEAERLGVAFSILPIETGYEGMARLLGPRLDAIEGVTAENLQARLRGVALMAISNASGKLVLSTSNKSETAVGYTTLYGDMVGGFAPLKDVLKTQVYALARWRNGVSPVIPQRVIERPPSAELRPDQVDQDSLPDYAVLDRIIQGYVVEQKTPAQLIDEGLDAEAVRLAIRLINGNEYKRRQAPPGVRVTTRSFGRDRRYPITSHYEESV